MAKVTFDPGVSGYRGRAGNSVFRKRGSKTILSKRPEHDGEPSEAQRAHRMRFAAAVKFGNEVMNDPARRAVYEEAASGTGKSSFSRMIMDSLNEPEVTEIDQSAYQGAPGDAITIAAEDDMAVVQVEVVVKDAEGTSIEAGPATMTSDGKWVYTTTEPVPPGTAVRIAATATDAPGGTHTLEKEAAL